MKMLTLILTCILAMTLTSCDVMYNVIFVNYGESTQLKVHYENKHKSGWNDRKTLTAQCLENSEFTSVLRTDIDSNTYIVEVPANHRIELMPKSIGTPLASVSYKSTSDSTISVGLFGQNWRRLKRQGTIDPKGLIFIHTIIINRK